MTSVETDGRQVIIEGGENVAYDDLVVATGATHHYFGHDAWAEAALGLKTIEDARLYAPRS